MIILESTRHRLVFALMGATLSVACESSSGGLARGAADSNASGSGGSTGGTVAAGGQAGESGQKESSGGGSSSDGESSGGESSGGSTGDTSGSGGSGGGETAESGGTGGEVSIPPVDECTFHNEPALDSGAGGEGGAGSEDVHIDSSSFVGDFLVDAEGMALYIYGADYPGDCNNPPISNCLNDCTLSWPVFDAGARSLGEGLPDEAFGTFERSDGLTQTTYLGWPLYYFKRDEEPGDLAGHGRGNIWFAAETVLPNILVMRASEADGGMQYLSDQKGFTLYTYAEDEVASGEDPPASACSDDCLDDFVPLSLSSLRPASPIDPAEVTVFIRDDSSELQVAYRGMPLYTSLLDSRSGDLEGIGVMDWSLVEP